MERDKISMLVAENIKALMESRGMDAAKLARAAGLNATGIYDIISGKSKSPKIGTIAKIADGLGVPMVCIFETATDQDLRSDIEMALSGLPPERLKLLLRTALAWRDEVA